MIKNVEADGGGCDLSYLLDQSVLCSLHQRVLSLRLGQIPRCPLSIPHFTSFTHESAQLRNGSSWRVQHYPESQVVHHLSRAERVRLEVGQREWEGVEGRRGSCSSCSKRDRCSRGSRGMDGLRVLGSHVVTLFLLIHSIVDHGVTGRVVSQLLDISDSCSIC
ncbi:hypothetical protein PFISCL1PPCAC_12095, partial [Pristionchus fissidentatus]